MGLQTAVYILTYLGACIYNINNNEYILLTDFFNIKRALEVPMSTFTSKTTCLPAKSLQLYPTLCDPMDCSPSGSSVRGILKARILQWVAISFSRGSSWLRDGTLISLSPVSSGGLFTTSATWEFLHLYPHLLFSHLGSHGILSIPLSSLSQKSSVVPQLPFENSCLGPVLTQLNSHSKDIHQEQIALENQLEQLCPVTMLRSPQDSCHSGWPLLQRSFLWMFHSYSLS